MTSSLFLCICFAAWCTMSNNGSSDGVGGFFEGRCPFSSLFFSLFPLQDRLSFSAEPPSFSRAVSSYRVASPFLLEPPFIFISRREISLISDTVAALSSEKPGTIIDLSVDRFLFVGLRWETVPGSVKTISQTGLRTFVSACLTIMTLLIDC